MEYRENVKHLKAEITDIQRFSVHDGFGIRTLVFFKGCPLRCIWCHNPETQQKKPQLLYMAGKCIICDICIDVCPEHAIIRSEDGLKNIRDRCTDCGVCTQVCYAGAREIVGRLYTVEDVLDIVLRDEVFYKNSGGGVTLSGGDPVVHVEFASELLRMLKERGIHTAIETCGACELARFKTLIENVDLVLFDLKHADTNIHKKYTGMGNEEILRNLSYIGDQKKALIIRVPLIPGINDSPSNLIAVAKYALQNHALQIHLLPFHKIGEAKWEGLDYSYQLKGKSEPDSQLIERAYDILSSCGIHVNIGGYSG